MVVKPVNDKRFAISDKLVTLLTVFLFASFFLFESFTWGKYVLLATAGCILFISIIKQKGIIYFKIDLWHKYILAIAIFSLMSAVWGISSSDSIQKFITTMQILIILSVIYISFQDKDNVERLINIIKWGGYTVGIVSFGFYGLDFIILMLKTGIRLENGFSNVNSIGILCAFSIIIELYEMLYYKRLKFSVIFCIPSIVLLLATQSRKAFVLLIIGLLLVFLATRKDKRNKVRTFFYFLIILTIFCLFAFLLSKLSVFSGINARLGYLLDTIHGEGKVGSSAVLRSQMIEVGWNCFKRHPFIGVGYGCPHVVNMQEINFDAYLHNNYIELLAGGGLVGFFIFYSFYYSLFRRIFNYRNIEHFGTSICLIFMVLLLIADFGMVTCYSKETYFYFMVFFLFTKELKKLSFKKQNYVSDSKLYF